MKNNILLLICIIGLFIVSCASAKKYSIGMSESEFKQQNRSAELVNMESNTAVYKIVKVVMTSHPGVKFYYFRDSKLVRMDEGEDRPDILIENKH